MELIPPLAAFIAGIVTILNPCVLPILPIVLATALREGKWGPIALAAGLGLTFTIIFVVLSQFASFLPVGEGFFVPAGGVMLIVLGLLLLIPGGQKVISMIATPLQSGANSILNRFALPGVSGQFVIGMILGLAWSPCIGPVLGAAANLTLSASNFFFVLLIALCFSLGTGTVLVALSYGSRELIGKRRTSLMSASGWIQPVTGAVMLAVGLIMVTGLYRLIDAWVSQILPPWLLGFSTSF